ARTTGRQGRGPPRPCRRRPDPAPTPPIIRPAGASGRRRVRPAAHSVEPPPFFGVPVLPVVFLAAGFFAAVAVVLLAAVFFAGALARRSASSSAARSSVIDSTSSPLRSEALVSPSVT